MTDTSMLSEFDLPERIDAGLWRRIYGHTRPYKRSMLGLASTGVLMAALDAAFPRLIAALIDGVVQEAPGSTLLWLGGAYAIV